MSQVDRDHIRDGQFTLVVFLELTPATFVGPSLYKCICVTCSRTTELRSSSGSIARTLTGSHSCYLAHPLSPFITDMGLQNLQLDRSRLGASRGWLECAIWACHQEYPTIWVAETCTDFKTGFPRNRPRGVAISSKAEATCFTHMLESS